MLGIVILALGGCRMLGHLDPQQHEGLELIKPGSMRLDEEPLTGRKPPVYSQLERSRAA